MCAYVYVCCVLCLAASLCPSLATPWTVAHQAPLFMGILQGRILDWIAIPFSRDPPNTGIKPRSRTLQVDSLPSKSPGKPCIYVCVCVCVCVCVFVYYCCSLLTKLCLILQQPYGLQPARLSVLGIPQAGMGCHFLLQEILLTQGSNLYLLDWQVDSLPLSHQKSPPKDDTNALIYKRVIVLQTINLWLPKGKGEQGINQKVGININTLLLLLSRFSCVWLYATPQTGLCTPPGSAVPGILRQVHWSGLPFPSPIHESEK